MNFDELMAVWKSQDAAPLHDVNKALLRLALRHDEAKLLAERRRERWGEFLGAAVCFGIMGLLLTLMIYPDDDDGRLTAWDYAIPLVGMAAVLLAVGAMYVNHKRQARREQNYGESLHEQINRQIAQLDFWATRVHRARVFGAVLLSVVIVLVLDLAYWRINDRAYRDDELWISIVLQISFCAFCSAVSFWRSRRRLQREVLPRKRRLEALLKELDGQ